MSYHAWHIQSNIIELNKICSIKCSITKQPTVEQNQMFDCRTVNKYLVCKFILQTFCTVHRHPDVNKLLCESCKVADNY